MMLKIVFFETLSACTRDSHCAGSLYAACKEDTNTCVGKKAWQL